MQSKLVWIRLLLTVATLCGIFFAIEGQSAEKPNIIWIMADDLGYGDLGCYGQEVIQTPNIDRLAEGGMRFTDCYSGSTVCAPSRCCLMTGLHSGHAYVRGNKRVPLRPEDVTIAEVLKEKGYVTGQFGKWGLGEPDTTGGPLNQGFDRFFGYTDQRHAHNYYPEFLWDNDQKVTLKGNLDGKQGEYTHSLIVEKGLDFVQENKDQPFFLYFSVTIPHANNEYGRETGDGMQVPDYGVYQDEDWANPQKGHAAMISLLDSDVGRIMELLKNLEIAENTLVFFTSDNGPHREGGADPDFFDSNGPLKGIKRDLYDGGIRVPMIAHWPGKIAAGTESDFVWAFWDFPSTAAEIVGTAMPGEVDGQSVLPTLLGKDQKEPEYLYWEFHERAFKQGVRFGEWKGVRNDLNKPVEIYQVTQDLGEEDNLADQQPELVKRVEGWFESARTESEHWPVKRE